MKKHLKAIICIVWILVAAGIGLGLSLSKGIDLYHPDPRLPTPLEAGVPDVQPVTIHTQDGLALTSWYLKGSDPARPVILFFMGDTGSLADRASDFKPYIEKGYGIFLLGYRGFGGNPGKPSEHGLYRDARAAIAWLGKEGYNSSRVVLYGHSLGTGIAVEMGTEIYAYAVVLEAPYTTLPDTVVMNIPFTRSSWFMKDRFDNLSKIGYLKAPVLIIQGDEDEVIPEAQGKALYKAAIEPKLAHFIPNGGHSDLYDYGAADMVMDFLDNPPKAKNKSDLN